MEEAPENDKESSLSTHANGMNGLRRLPEIGLPEGGDLLLARKMSAHLCGP